MSKTRDQKKQIIEKIEDYLEKQKAVYFIDFKGLPAGKFFKLRKEVQKCDGLIYVTKKKLLEIAFKNKGIGFEKKQLKGQTALIFSFKDTITPIKKAYELAKEGEAPKILGGVFEGKIIGNKEAICLAQLPTKQELQVKLVMGLKAPLFGLNNALSRNLKGLLYLLKKKSAIT